jgi:hypothetical protein
MPTRRLAPAVVIATLAVAPVPASAMPVLQPSRSCYRAGDQIALSGSGYTPSGSVDVFFSLDGTYGTEFRGAGRKLVADADGQIAGTFKAPGLAWTDRRETLTITAEDRARLAAEHPPTTDAFGATTVALSAFTVIVRPWEVGHVRPRRKVTIRAFGFEPFTTLWAHYLRGRKRVATVRLGDLVGPCGDLTTRIRQFPFRPVRPGTYAVYFEPVARFSRHAPRVRYTHLRVTRRRAVR